jgi:hypothetical protein
VQPLLNVRLAAQALHFDLGASKRRFEQRGHLDAGEAEAFLHGGGHRAAN